ncbi:MAG TPA: rRNA methyltransferase [Bacteroidia bacterium]|jgi:16S rRNA C967 or C1407 C5-methylase (RsmB/RsmF family)/NOL1/NOP2/fmu family ribosome biogenesis protein|nr:rRNA methyltransferase [Bacteroidia bacterium]
MQLPKAHTELVKQLLGDEFPQWEKSFGEAPPVSIRVNPLKWKNNYPGTRIPWCETGYYLPSRPSFTMDPFFHAGYYYVQEASSMGIEQAMNQLVDLSKNVKVLDLCAAPGGKSTHLLSLITENSLLVSNEVIRSRANILVENLVKWGRDNFIVTNNDPEHIGELTEFFDVMLADAPCSGEGLFRRDHDAMKEWSAGAVELCTMRQRRIILDAWPALKENGFLIYSTCTFNEEENEKNIVWLKEKIKFESVELQFPADWGIVETKKNGIHGYRFFPHRLKGEGFFLTVLQKKEHSSSKPGKQKPVMNLLNNREKELVKNYVNDPARFDFFSFDGLVTLFRKTISSEMQTVCRRLNVVHAGLAIAELAKGLKAVHPLAVSTELNRRNFPEVELSKEDALKFLAREEVKLVGEKTGMTLVTFKGAPLGWLNALGNRANNLYPKEWRIRHL